MKTKFQPPNGKTFKDLKAGDVFIISAAGRTAIPLVRAHIPHTAWNAVNVMGDTAIIGPNDSVVHYPNAVLDMGQPS